MGQEISHSRFSAADFREFGERLEQETRLLAEWFAEERFAADPPVGGFEIEAWLVDREMRPAPLNETFLERLADPLVVSELARFNVELNTPPHPLVGDALAVMRREISALRGRCTGVAADLGAALLSIGILPTLHDTDLCLANMSPLQRYRALNNEVLKLRRGHPLQVEIQGAETLSTVHGDVMLEAAATSLQLHIQVPQAQATRYYNAARILSAPLVAVCANSPYLFGRDLWDETRIPLFEQAVAVPASAGRNFPARVSFGEWFPEHSLMECFAANLSKYPVLLPRLQDTPPEALAHLRLHNGTIWRWNRPLIGLDGERPHLRVEHRVNSAPTSDADTIANAALFYGLVVALANAPEPAERRIAFATARDNFYAAARHGLRAEIVWLDGRPVAVDALLRDTLLPLAYSGLQRLAIDPGDAADTLGIIAARIASGQNGAAWQRRFVAAHGRDMRALTAAYAEHQAGGQPVHEWGV